ncbi:pyridoxamine 5'-phosphate oxidase [Altericista sp. CCNU0014]|uniref:pyridoxamine 5'-phosphate oxidase n=1 Tax=Altericista sp. CCNU0014 TaxID=3082949 RepID=UPI00384FE225
MSALPSSTANPSIDIGELRRDYSRQMLLESNVESDPFLQFQHWFAQALEAQVIEPNAMTLATVTPEGRPAARIVLLKGFDERGFVFYSNFQSRKGREIAQNPAAALVFWWGELERQVRIEGSITLVSETEADAYFQSRPRGSQLGAWVSDQSQAIADRSILEERLQHLEQDYRGASIPRPPHWGGYRVAPIYFEFWQGRSNRLHDRLCYRHATASDPAWKVERLSP